MPQATLNTRTGTNDTKNIASLTGRHGLQSALPHKRSAHATIRALRHRKTGKHPNQDITTPEDRTEAALAQVTIPSLYCPLSFRPDAAALQLRPRRHAEQGSAFPDVSHAAAGCPEEAALQ